MADQARNQRESKAARRLRRYQTQLSQCPDPWQRLVVAYDALRAAAAVDPQRAEVVLPEVCRRMDEAIRTIYREDAS